MNQDLIRQQANDINLDNALVAAYKNDHVKKVFTPFLTLGKELINKLPSVHGDILVLSDAGLLVSLLRRLKSEGLNPEKVLFISHTEEVQAFVLKLGVRSIFVGYNKIQSWLKENMEQKFNVIIGNPPFNGKSSIHLKIVGRLEKIIADNGVISLILPKPILVRQSERCGTYTSWLDSCSTIEWGDIEKTDFPSVADDLVWFMVKNDNGHSMVDITVKPPSKTWSAKYVTGLDFSQCEKKKTTESPIPVINCVSSLGDPTFGKFTTASAVKKISKYVGKPIMHVNAAGSMAARPEIAWLDETGEHPYYRHYMETLVFDSLDEAKEALEWIKSDEGKKYFNDWLRCGWGINTGLKLLIKPI